MNEKLDIPLSAVGSKRFFRKLDWSAFWTACALSFAVYFYTLAPTLTLEDSGELATGGAFLGVPHPPGYPIWTFMVWLFTKAFFWVHYRGQPNPAWSIGLASAVFGAIATGCTAMLVCRSGSDMLKESKDVTERVDQSTQDVTCWVSGVASSLIFSFSPVVWSQSVIVEAYSLNALFLTLIFLLVYAWTHTKSNGWLYMAAYLFGLGLTNYQVLLLALVPLALVVMLKDLELFRDIAILAIPYAVVLAIINIAALPAMPGLPRQPPIKPGDEFSMTLMPQDSYLWIFLTVALVVASSVALWLMKKDQRWPIIPSSLLTIGAIALLVLLSNIPDPYPFQPREGEEIFSWTLYSFALFVAMLALFILCFPIRNWFILGVPFLTICLTLAVLLKKGVLVSLVISPPASLWFSFYVFLDFVFLALAAIMLPRGRVVALTILAAQLGLAFYIYEPLVSDLRNPPMNWGYPRTWEGFKHALGRQQYEKIIPTPIVSMQFANQVGDFLTDIRATFTIPIALLGLLPFTAWSIKLAGRRFKAIYLAIVIALIIAPVTLAEEIWFPEGIAAVTQMYKMLASAILCLVILGGFILMIGQIMEWWGKVTRNDIGSILTEKIMAGFILLGIVAIYLVYGTTLTMKFLEVTAPLRQAGQTIASEQTGLIFLQGGGLLLLVIVPAVLAVITAWLMKSKFELGMMMNVRSQKWIMVIVVGFLIIGIILVDLANPKGDIQDAFIQRVKYISSHAFYILWVGFGMVFGLVFVNILFKGNRLIKWGAAGAAMMLSLIPIQQNIYNKELVRINGGAEQNGHDFGWQFGNYQLRGAEAVGEELSPDEEPLPNPEFPQEMGQNAIFYGGTDPGRFVPTYMIYCAEVREDVYLITQNALADSTYMSVMRDLYGDRIWIPAQPDSAMAFQRYVEEVQTGKRQANADLKIENGRVQVSGALGVMEINGILAEMIFEHNKYKHPFYVEESYVIRWMYPFLTPHGLIMKINKDRCDIPPDNIRDDTDFWDWYTRRLMNDRGFLRDVVARKSFSKLRSAIAGLYANRGRFPEAENAFQQARVLYPLSPEANFRLAQEVFMPQSRFTDARLVVEEFGKMDPGNGSVSGFINQVKRIEDMFGRVATLEQQITTGRLDINNAFELADLYLQLGFAPKFMSLAANLTADTNLPPIFHLRLAQLLARAGRMPEMIRALDMCVNKLPQNTPPEAYLDIARMYGTARAPDKMVPPLEKYLQGRPADWKAWFDMSIVKLGMNKTNDAVKAMSEALRFGGAEANKIFSEDPRFAPFRNKLQSRTMNLMGVPGVMPLR